MRSLPEVLGWCSTTQVTYWATRSSSKVRVLLLTALDAVAIRRHLRCATCNNSREDLGVTLGQADLRSPAVTAP